MLRHTYKQVATFFAQYTARQYKAYINITMVDISLFRAYRDRVLAIFMEAPWSKKSVLRNFAIGSSEKKSTHTHTLKLIKLSFYQLTKIFLDL